MSQKKKVHYQGKQPRLSELVILPPKAPTSAFISARSARTANRESQYHINIDNTIECSDFLILRSQIFNQKMNRWVLLKTHNRI